MGQRRIDKGTKLFFGAPAQPMPASRSVAIRDAVAAVNGVEEAHLPQCFIEGDAQAHQVLVIGVRSKGEIPRIVEELMRSLSHIPMGDQYLDILPFETSSIPQAVRSAGCQIVDTTGKPWWKVW